MDIKSGFWTIQRSYSDNAAKMEALGHDTRLDAQEFAHELSLELGKGYFVDVVADGKLISAWRDGVVIWQGTQKTWRTAQ